MVGETAARLVRRDVFTLRVPAELRETEGLVGMTFESEEGRHVGDKGSPTS